MEIRTPRLTLRPLTQADLATTHAYAGDLENTRLMMFLPYADEAETAAFLEYAEAQWRLDAPERYEFAICLNDAAGTHIGGITLYMQEDRGEAELGWVLHKAHWRKGYVSEAAQALLAHARTMGIRRVFACCDSENAPSYGALEKLGFRRCGQGTRTNRSMGDEVRTELIYDLRLDDGN